MAYGIVSKPNTTAPDADYPFGRIRDNDGSNNGTPVNTLVYGDFHQFFAKLMSEAGVTPNNLPDNAYSGFQLFESLVRLFGGVRRSVIEIGTWDMDTADSVTVSTDIAYADVRGYQFMIANDAGTNVYTGGIIGGLTPAVDAFCAGADNSGDIQFLLARRSGGGFDSSTFSGSGNRGYIIIEHVGL